MSALCRGCISIRSIRAAKNAQIIFITRKRIEPTVACYKFARWKTREKIKKKKHFVLEQNFFFFFLTKVWIDLTTIIWKMWQVLECLLWILHNIRNWNKHSQLFYTTLKQKHSEVDYFSIPAHSEVFYSPNATVIDTYTFYPFIVTFDVKTVN